MLWLFKTPGFYPQSTPLISAPQPTRGETERGSRAKATYFHSLTVNRVARVVWWSLTEGFCSCVRNFLKWISPQPGLNPNINQNMWAYESNQHWIILSCDFLLSVTHFGLRLEASGDAKGSLNKNKCGDWGIENVALAWSIEKESFFHVRIISIANMNHPLIHGMTAKPCSSLSSPKKFDCTTH